MSKNKSILLVGCLALLFLAMIFIDGEDQKTQNQQEEEVIYLSYNQEPPVSNDVVLKPVPQVVAVNPNLGHLAIPSVIIHKKSSETLWVHHEEQATDKVSIAKQQDSLSYKVFQGHRFNAVLTHAINSDLPGMVVAEISQTVFGYQADIPLLPKGTRLIGHYTNELKVGDARLNIAWDRAITPNGIDIQLNSLATDRLGQTGLGGEVDNHFWSTFGTSVLLSSMAIGASNLSNDQGEFSNQYQQGVTNAFVDTSSTILENRLIRKPTIYIHQGEIIHVMVTQDLDFSKVLNSSKKIPVF